MSQTMPDDRTEHVLVWEGEQAIGWGSLNHDTQQKLHLAHARLIVHPQCRRRGLGRALVAVLEQTARRAMRRTGRPRRLGPSRRR